MRPTVLVLALIACAGVVFYASNHETTVDAVAMASIPDQQRHVDSTRTEAELERGAVEVSPPIRTEAAPQTARLEIRIVDESGSAGAGIRLRLFRRESMYLFARVGRPDEDLPWIRTTDADGLAIWNGLEPDEDCRWAAYYALVDYQPAPIGEETGLSGSFALRAGETTQLTGRLASTLTIVGQVQDSDSKPRMGVQVAALRRDSDARSVMMTNTTDAEGRFTLRRVRVVPLRLECVTVDAPDLLTFVTHDFDPVSTDRLDVGVLRLEGRTLNVALRAVDASGRDVTDLAATEGGRSIPVQAEGCGEIQQQIRIPLGGSFRMVGFECPGVKIGIPRDPPPGSCAPGWLIDWKRSVLEVAQGMEGDLRLDVLATPGQEIAFSASAIHRAGVSDQRGVAVLQVSLHSEESQARIEFEMRALLGLSFDGTFAVPLGKYQLDATCEDEDTLWTATREVTVARDTPEPVRIDLVRVR